MTARDFFSGTTLDLPGLARFLDDLDHESRVREVRTLTGSDQAALYEAVAGFRPLTLEDFVPPQVSALDPVIHYGRNSLPLFKIFEKRFCRPDRAKATEALWGYNEQTFKSFTGPGYFVARPADKGEVVIDYCELPPAKPASWPEILPNSARLSRFIYYRTRDFMRGVGAHVTIGRATRDGKPMDNWFVLSRDSRPR